MRRERHLRCGRSPALRDPRDVADRGRADNAGEQPDGFANFELSPEGTPGEVITAPGEITPQFLELRGLIRTTLDARSAMVRRLEGSRPGLVIDPPFAFLGYAIPPIVEVHLDPGFDGDDLYCDLAGQVYLTWSGENRRVRAVPAEATGAELALSLSHGGETVELARLVPGFRRVVASFSAGFIEAARDGSAPGPRGEAAISLNFEDIIGATHVHELPAHPAGLVFHNFIFAHRLYYRRYGYVNATTSAEFSIYTSSGHPARISGDAFELESVNMGVACLRPRAAWPAWRAFSGGEGRGAVGFAGHPSRRPHHIRLGAGRPGRGVP